MKNKEVERRNVWVYQPERALENTPLEIRVTEPGVEKKLIGRLYVSKGGIVWCNNNQRMQGKRKWNWNEIAEKLGK